MVTCTAMLKFSMASICIRHGQDAHSVQPEDERVISRAALRLRQDIEERAPGVSVHSDIPAARCNDLDQQLILCTHGPAATCIANLACQVCKASRLTHCTGGRSGPPLVPQATRRRDRPALHRSCAVCQARLLRGQRRAGPSAAATLLEANALFGDQSIAHQVILKAACLACSASVMIISRAH